MIKKKLEDHLRELNKYIEIEDTIVIKVSHASVYRHIDHVLRSTCILLQWTSCVSVSKKWFNPVFWVIMSFGWIPRWKAKSPIWTYTTELITQDSLYELLHQVEKLIDTYEDSLVTGYVHPDFGLISGPDTIKFAAIHIYHHLKIIRDIKKASKWGF